jgi:hypothetical protein
VALNLVGLERLDEAKEIIVSFAIIQLVLSDIRICSF